MPRQARLDIPGALHHIIVRGINKADIFDDDQDKTRFLERLGDLVTKGQCRVYAWVLMSNHVHILLIRSQGSWSRVLAMRRRGQKEEFDERILGGGDFVNNILKEAEDSHMCQLKAKRSGKTIEKLIEEECRKRGISPLELKGGGKRRKVSDTRAVIALRGRDELGLSAAEIARQVGVNTSGITKAIERAEQRYGYKYHK